MDEPLIYTSRGNLPERSLRYVEQWEDTPTYTKLTMQWFVEGDAVPVRASASILAKQGFQISAEAGKVG